MKGLDSEFDFTHELDNSDIEIDLGESTAYENEMLFMISGLDIDYPLKLYLTTNDLEKLSEGFAAAAKFARENYGK